MRRTPRTQTSQASSLNAFFILPRYYAGQILFEKRPLVRQLSAALAQVQEKRQPAADANQASGGDRQPYQTHVACRTFAPDEGDESYRGDDHVESEKRPDMSGEQLF